MKNYLIISLLFLSLGFSQKEYNFNDLIKMDNGLYTEKFSDEPISGKVFGYFGEFKPLKKVYIGNLLNGKKEGKWTEWDEYGKKISEWNYIDGLRNGQGTSTSPDGRKYVGEYKDGKRDGQGTYTSPDGEKYVGDWKDGKQNGQGTFTYANGSIYIGEWKDNKFDGLGVFFPINGEKEPGSWSQDVFKNTVGMEAVDKFLNNKYPQFKGLNYSVPSVSSPPKSNNTYSKPAMSEYEKQMLEIEKEKLAIAKRQQLQDKTDREKKQKKERNKAFFDALMGIAIDKTSDESGNQQSSNKRTCQYDGTKLVYTLDTKMDWTDGAKKVRLWKCKSLAKTHEYWIIE